MVAAVEDRDDAPPVGPTGGLRSVEPTPVNSHHQRPGLYNPCTVDDAQSPNLPLDDVLRAVAAGSMSVAQARDQLTQLPYEDLKFARVDHHRTLRTGVPEVVYAEGKQPQELVSILEALLAREGAPILATRANNAHAAAVLERWPETAWHARARLLIARTAAPRTDSGSVLVVCAGTSDLPVAEEAARTITAHGVAVDELRDVGVAGVHRVLSELPRLRHADVVVVVAGMEGALPSLVAGLVAVPVIAVPTSVGYGAAFGGLAALLGMLNSCAVGVSVVNIDNGFGAGALAVRMLASRVAAPKLTA